MTQLCRLLSTVPRQSDCLWCLAADSYFPDGSSVDKTGTTASKTDGTVIPDDWQINFTICDSPENHA